MKTIRYKGVTVEKPDNISMKLLKKAIDRLGADYEASMQDIINFISKNMNTINIPKAPSPLGSEGSFSKPTPSSSSVERIQYDAKTRLFTIYFKKGSVYDYHGVSQEDANKCYNSEKYGTLAQVELSAYRGVKR